MRVGTRLLFLLGFCIVNLARPLTVKFWKRLAAQRNARIVKPLPVDNNVDEHFMDLAIEEASKAERIGEVPIGAVVVYSTGNGKQKILSKAGNRMESSHDASAHAEMLALQQAASRQENWRLINCTLYSTLEPCVMCLAACQAFRVGRVVYGAPDLRLGAVETHIRLLDVVHPSHNISDVVGGIRKEESADLLRSFFRKRRREAKKSKSKTVSTQRTTWRISRRFPWRIRKRQ